MQKRGACSTPASRSRPRRPTGSAAARTVVPRDAAARRGARARGEDRDARARARCALAKGSLNGIELLDAEAELPLRAGLHARALHVAATRRRRATPSSRSATRSFARRARSELGAMDLRYTARAAGLPRRGARLARGERAGASRCLLRHGRRCASSHRAWESEAQRGGWAMVPWPEEYGGRGANLLEWLIFEEEYYRARRAEARQPERHLPARPDDHGVRHAGAEGALPAEDGVERGGLGAGLVASRTPAATWRRSRPLRGATATTTCCNGQKTWASRGAFADWLFGMFRTDPTSRAPPRPHLRARAARTRRASRCARSRSSTARRASPRSSSTTRACRSRTRLGERGPGLERRDGDRRLRARPDAAQPGALPGHGRAPGRALPRRTSLNVERRGARRSRALLDRGAEAYTLETYRTVSRLLAGGKIGAEASLNKIFW